MNLLTQILHCLYDDITLLFIVNINHPQIFLSGGGCRDDQSGAPETRSGQESCHGYSKRGNSGILNGYIIKKALLMHFVLYIIQMRSLIIKFCVMYMTLFWNKCFII